MKKTVQELEMQACRTFVCPNISLIEEKGKILLLKEETIERAKKLAIEYFKKTYHRPHYSSARYLLPAFIYIASIRENDKRTQSEISVVFHTTHTTIKRWYRDILSILDMELLPPEEDVSLDIDALMIEIDKGGKSLSLRRNTIEKAKMLTLKYMETVDVSKHLPYIKQLLPAFIYTASVIENDKRTQYDIFEIFDISESTVSKWYNNILEILNMKVISNYGRVICVKKIKEDYEM